MLLAFTKIAEIDSLTSDSECDQHSLSMELTFLPMPKVLTLKAFMDTLTMRQAIFELTLVNCEPVRFDKDSFALTNPFDKISPIFGPIGQCLTTLTMPLSLLQHALVARLGPSTHSHGHNAECLVEHVLRLELPLYKDAFVLIQCPSLYEKPMSSSSTIHELTIVRSNLFYDFNTGALSFVILPLASVIINNFGAMMVVLL